LCLSLTTEPILNTITLNSWTGYRSKIESIRLSCVMFLNLGMVFKTEAVVFSCRLCFPRAFPIISLISPNYMVEHFIPQDSIHSYSTRFSKEGCYSFPKVGSSGAKTFAHAGCHLWNSLPANLKSSNVSHLLKLKLKTTFLQYPCKLDSLDNRFLFLWYLKYNSPCDIYFLLFLPMSNF